MTRLRLLPTQLDQIEIASPCTVPWDGMRGDARVRFCGQCKQNVYNIEQMTRAEALRLITAREGRSCVRILRRNDGSVVTADCWTRLRAARRRGIVAFLAMLVVVGSAQLWAMRHGLGRGGAVARPAPPVAAQPSVAPQPSGREIQGATMGLPPRHRTHGHARQGGMRWPPRKNGIKDSLMD